jgi:LuxR family transcriptional regulator, maltose regulon positive regulatory protein
MVRRERLLARVAEGLRRRLLLIVAPPGFGKTTLLVAVTAGGRRQEAGGRRQEAAGSGAQHSLPPGASTASVLLPEASAASVLPPALAWLSLDETDNDPTRFFGNVIAALDRIAPGVGDHALTMLRSPTPAPMEVVLGALLDDLAELPHECVLVLDDYHIITNRLIHKGMALVVERLPQQAHLVISTRSEPPLVPLARLRLRDELVELRVADLRFSLEEVGLYLTSTMGLRLEPGEIAALEARTEGWIGALALAALSLREHSAPKEFIAGFRGNHRHLVDYLAGEVFRRQHAAIQEFLLHTSVLDQVCGDLADALSIQHAIPNNGSTVQPEPDTAFYTPPAALILEQIEAAGLFLIPLDEERRWYRYHTLFAEFLRERLQREQPGLVPVLRKRAAAWYAAKGLPVEAIGYLLAAGDLDEATILIERTARPILLRSEVSTVLGWLNAIPPAELQARPALCVVMAWSLAVSGQFEAIAPYLAQAELAIASQGVESPASEIIAIRATVAGLQRDVPRTIALAREALALLPDESVLVRSVVALMLGTATYLSGNMVDASSAFADAIRYSRAGNLLIISMFGLRQLGELQMRMGQLQRAAATFQSAIDLAGEYYPEYTAGGLAGRPIPVAGTAYVGLGLLQYEWNNLTQAEQLLRSGIKLGQQGSNIEILLMGPIGLAKVQLAQGNSASARVTLGEALDYARRMGVPRLADWLGAEYARLNLYMGDGRAALAWDNERRLDINDPISYLLEIDYLTLAQTRLFQERHEEALHLLERLLKLAEQEQRTSSVIEIYALEGLVLAAQGKSIGARRVLRRALDMAAPEGFVRVFVDFGHPMQALLAQELQLTESEGRGRGVFATYVRSLLAAFPAERENEPGRPTHQNNASAPPPGEPISPRELEVLRLVAAGLSNQEIAERLVVGLSTVKKHINNLYGKLEVKSRTQALKRAREIGVL